MPRRSQAALAPARALTGAALAGGCVAVALGCGDPGGRPVPGGDFQATDSAGVVLAVSRAPAWSVSSAEEAWRISPDPALELGAAGSEPAHQFGQVVDALRLGDGRLVVADAAAGEVRYYEPGGAFLFAVGGGQGAPSFGELGSLSRLPGDSLLAFDADRQRLVVLTPSGEVAGESDLRWEGEVSLDRALPFADGTIAVPTGWSTSQVGGMASGVVRPMVTFLRFARDGSALGTVAVAPGIAVATVTLGGGARTFLPTLLGAVTVYAVLGDQLHVGTGERFEIRAYTPDGALRRILRVPGADLSVSPEELEAARAERRAMGRGSPVAEQLLARLEAALPDPVIRPAYGALRVDAAGNLWIGEYPWLGLAPAPSRQPRRWTVFDPEGRMLGSLEAPEPLELLDVGEDYLLGLRWSPQGGQDVVMYDIVR